MPELPEVETIVRSLRPRLLQKKICGIDIFLPKIVHAENKTAFQLIGKTIINITRQGKNIIMELSKKYYLRIHLKMTGQLLLNSKGDALLNHTHAIFYLDKGRLELRYRDIRQFGYIQILTAKEWNYWLNHNSLGPDPLEISFPALLAKLRRKKGKIKSLLLDQSFLSGLGNIYTDEILHQARIHPENSPLHLSTGKIRCLHQKMQSILQIAIQLKGSSVRNYIEASGAKGQYQTEHQVYGRAGLPCRQCGTPLKKIRVSGRGTCFCPRCQPLLDLARP